MIKPKPPEKWEPAKYQKRGVKWLLEHACAGLLFKPGLRKTSVTLAAISFLKKRGLINKVLVVAPKKVCYTVWPLEVKKWKDFNHLKVEILHGPKRNEALKREADIYTITAEGLQWLLAPEITRNEENNRKWVTVDTRAFKKLGFDVLVVDELSKFKHTTSLRFKTLKTILHLFGRRWGLTGSPRANGLEDLFGQTYILDMGNALGEYVSNFRREFFEAAGPYALVPKLDAEERIYEKLSNLMMHVPESEIDLPERVNNDILIDFDETSRRIYEEMEAIMLAQVDDKLVRASNAASKSMKCRQICSGGIYLDPEVMTALQAVKIKHTKREWVNLHDHKTDALEDLVDEMQHNPLLVAYDFKHDIDRLKKRFPKAVFIGDVSDKEYPRVEERWNAGDISLMFGHPQSIGHGLNLQGCGADICWHTPTWDQDLYDQFVRRVIRSGNKSKHTMVHRLLMRNTIEDLVMMPCLEAKEGGQQLFFDALLNLSNQRRFYR